MDHRGGRQRRQAATASRGSALPLLALAVVVTVGVVAGMVGLGREAADRAQLRTAADAAALAGAGGGRSAAATVAGANRARLIAYEELADGSIRVTVGRGDEEVSARARATPMGWMTEGGPGDVP